MGVLRDVFSIQVSSSATNLHRLPELTLRPSILNTEYVYHYLFASRKRGRHR